MAGPVRHDWLTNEQGVSYPPEPWHLGGTIHASLWLIPRDQVEPLLLKGTRIVSWGGQAVLVTAWANYAPGGVLSYNEMLSAILVRANRKLAFTVAHIFVDSAASAAGGRELWGMPKSLASFQSASHPTFNAALSVGSDILATFRFRPTVPLPFSWPMSLKTAQLLDGGLRMTSFQARGRIAFGRGNWTFNPAGPFQYLVGHHPMVSVRLDRMALSCGIQGGITEVLAEQEQADRRLDRVGHHHQVFGKREKPSETSLPSCTRLCLPIDSWI